MRLQIAIFRNTLPPVNIIYNTTSAPVPIKTVSDLLNAINTLVPLESSDGEWGLEEYTVEVAATADQDQTYECLHFQFVKDVLREDDEVVIRGLTSEELRERRQGGRSQITSDGRHLLDGVSWGKRWRVQAQRPGVRIPPRKKRRLLPTEDDVNEDEVEQQQQLEYLPAAPQIGTVIDENEDDEEDDEDFEADEDDNDEDPETGSDESGSTDVESDTDNGTGSTEQRLQLYTRQEFDDADEAEDDESELDLEEASLEMEVLLDQIGEELENGVSSLDNIITLHSDTVQDHSQRTISQPRMETRSSKRKRGVDDDGARDGHEGDFEGFTSPATTSAGKSQISENGTAIGKIGPYPVRTQLLSQDIASDETTDDEEQSSVSTSSGESLSSDSEDSSDTDSESDDEMSSESDDDTTSSSSEDVVRNIKGKQVTHDELLGDAARKNAGSGKATPTSNRKGDKNNPPGSGTKRTKQNNDRAKRKKRLQALKKQGLLPEDAGYEALRRYDEPHRTVQENDESAGNNDAVPEDTLEIDAERLHKQKEELLARINADSSGSDAGDARATPEIVDDTVEQVGTQQHELSREPAGQPAEVAVEKAANSETPAKRARLDVESSRRMLFSSLGLRTPKTKAAEEALRAKLSEPVRKVNTKLLPAQNQVGPDHVMQSEEDASWQTKLKIFAVECVEEGVKMAPPPFPFRQRWELETGTVKAQPYDHKHSHRGNAVAVSALELVSNGESVEQDAAQDNNRMSLMETESKTISLPIAELDDLSNTEELTKLPNLVENDVLDGAVIAYRQLRINERFEPEESAYRVAQVSKVDDGLIGLVLASKYRESSSARYDEETGERILHGLEMPDEVDSEEDDGYREVRLEEMIQPKLIKASTIEQAASADSDVPHMPHEQDHQSFEAVPESVPRGQAPQSKLDKEQVDVNTSRRKEITTMITEAGFDSGLDDQLLMPITLSAALGTENRSSMNSAAHPARPGGQELHMQAPAHISSLMERSSSPQRGGEDGLLHDSRTQHVTTSSVSNGTSPPTISLVETVDYPYVSLMDHDDSSFPEQLASSSHQDAQRLSHDAPHVAHSNISQPQTQRAESGESQAMEFSGTSLPSEVSQSLLDPISQAVQGQDSYIGLRGGHGTASSPERETEATDSDGLPSLRALTTSQKYRSVSQLSRLSPPADIKTSQHLDKADSDRLSPALDFDQGSNVEHESVIKASQSQQPRLSQISQNVSIIDLTSSDPVQPSEGSDKEYVERVQPTRARRVTKREVNGSHAGAKMMKSALAAAGKRRSLAGKKRSNV